MSILWLYGVVLFTIAPASSAELDNSCSSRLVTEGSSRSLLQHSSNIKEQLQVDAHNATSESAKIHELASQNVKKDEAVQFQVVAGELQILFNSTKDVKDAEHAAIHERAQQREEKRERVKVPDLAKATQEAPSINTDARRLEDDNIHNAEEQRQKKQEATKFQEVAEREQASMIATNDATAEDDKTHGRAEQEAPKRKVAKIQDTAKRKPESKYFVVKDDKDAQTHKPRIRKENNEEAVKVHKEEKGKQTSKSATRDDKEVQSLKEAKGKQMDKSDLRDAGVAKFAKQIQEEEQVQLDLKKLQHDAIKTAARQMSPNIQKASTRIVDKVWSLRNKKISNADAKDAVPQSVSKVKRPDTTAGRSVAEKAAARDFGLMRVLIILGILFCAYILYYEHKERKWSAAEAEKRREAKILAEESQKVSKSVEQVAEDSAVSAAAGTEQLQTQVSDILTSYKGRAAHMQELEQKLASMTQARPSAEVLSLQKEHTESTQAHAELSEAVKPQKVDDTSLDDLREVEDQDQDIEELDTKSSAAQARLPLVDALQNMVDDEVCSDLPATAEAAQAQVQVSDILANLILASFEESVAHMQELEQKLISAFHSVPAAEVAQLKREHREGMQAHADISRELIIACQKAVDISSAVLRKIEDQDEHNGRSQAVLDMRLSAAKARLLLVAAQRKVVEDEVRIGQWCKKHSEAINEVRDHVDTMLHALHELQELAQQIRIAMRLGCITSIDDAFESSSGTQSQLDEDLSLNDLHLQSEIMDAETKLAEAKMKKVLSEGQLAQIDEHLTQEESDEDKHKELEVRKAELAFEAQSLAQELLLQRMNMIQARSQSLTKRSSTQRGHVEANTQVDVTSNIQSLVCFQRKMAERADNRVGEVIIQVTQLAKLEQSVIRLSVSDSDGHHEQRETIMQKLEDTRYLVMESVKEVQLEQQELDACQVRVLQALMKLQQKLVQEEESMLKTLEAAVMGPHEEVVNVGDPVAGVDGAVATDGSKDAINRHSSSVGQKGSARGTSPEPPGLHNRLADMETVHTSACGHVLSQLEPEAEVAAPLSARASSDASWLGKAQAVGEMKLKQLERLKAFVKHEAKVSRPNIEELQRLEALAKKVEAERSVA